VPSPALVATAVLVVALAGVVAALLVRRYGRSDGPGGGAAARPVPAITSPVSPAGPPATPADPPAPAPGGVVNIARRSLVLLGRQLALVDSLERDELDPDTLETLYRLDHLATRMRRYAESLLVLVGEDVGRHARAPMPLSDVVRTATSGIEQYPRIAVVPDEPDDEPVVLAHRALPLAHLLAELLENATAASDPATRVRVTTGRTGAGVRVSVSDDGLGMTDDEIEAATAVVRRPGGEHAAGSTQLGLHVVGRLARRLGATVEIRRGEAAGVVVDVHVPADVLVADPVAEPPVDAPGPGAAAAAGVTGTSPAGVAGPPAALPVRAALPRRRDVRRSAAAGLSPAGASRSGLPATDVLIARVAPPDGAGVSPPPEPTAWIPGPAPVTPSPTPFAGTPFALSPTADILPAGRERRPRRWGGEPAPTARATAAVPPPRARDLRGDLGRRSALASEALSELSMLSSYRPETTPGGAAPLQQRRPAEVPPPVPPPILAPAPRDPAAVGGLLAGFAAGARRGRVRPGGAPVPDGPAGVGDLVGPDHRDAAAPVPTPAGSGWRARPTTEEGP
jgi:hypothetical protein